MSDVVRFIALTDTGWMGGGAYDCFISSHPLDRYCPVVHGRVGTLTARPGEMTVIVPYEEESHERRSDMVLCHEQQGEADGESLRQHRDRPPAQHGVSRQAQDVQHHHDSTGPHGGHRPVHGGIPMESILRKVAMATSASAFEQSQRVYSVFGGGLR